MRRIAVTGSRGGMGSVIVRVLQEVGYEILGIDHVASDQSESDYIQFDLADAAGVNDALSSVDAVVHFGSVPGTDDMTTTEGFYNVPVAGLTHFKLPRT